jgi:hypothetical protein
LERLRHLHLVVYEGDQPPRISMQQQRPLRPFASLVFVPTFVGVISLALACVAGQRTDRLADTVMSDTLGSAVAVTVDSAQDPAQVTTPGDSGTLVPDSIAMLQGAPAPTRAPVVQPAAQSSSSAHRHTVKALSPLADSIANGLVFVPRDRAWFTVASRGKRMLVDIGRVDLPLKTDSLTRSAFLEAAEKLSPLPNGTSLRVRGPWGTEDTRIRGFDIWSGRIVARLEVSRSLDSAARAIDFLPGSAVRIDSAALLASQAPDSAPAGPSARKDSIAKAPPPPAAAAACQRDNIPWEMVARGVAVRDSIEQFLADSVQPPFERMIKTARVQSWTLPGCYGSARVIVLATKRTPDMEFATERVALIDSIGRAIPLRLSDLRFHAHEPLYVFDADGDGVDDLAVRGFGDRSGGLSIVRLDVAARRLVRLASGFAWER